MNDRRVRLRVCCGATLLVALASCQVGAQSDRSGPQRTRRVLYNLDGDSCMTLKEDGRGPQPITAGDLRQRVAEISQPGSQVDTLLVCINAQVMYYPTQRGTLRGMDSTESERAQWPAGEKQRFANMQSFFERGEDPYAILLAEAQARGLEALLTFRMNDAHGNDFLRTQFWREHPAWQLPRGALDFQYPAVTDHLFSLIEEAVQRYDCDGIELDFQRFPTFFRDDVDGATRLAATQALVARTRAMLDTLGAQRHKHLVLAVRPPSHYGRTPPSYESSREIGCDPVAWANHGLIDFLTVSEFLWVRYDLAIAPWKSRIPHIPIYGGIECAEGPGRDRALTSEKYHKAARHLLQEGADGIYLFNFFTTREQGDQAFEPPFEVLRSLYTPVR